jgi:prolipoprotein diacylglyceryltransferase
MTRVGVQTGSYVVMYSMVRIILEMSRDESDILFPSDYVGTYIFLGLGVIAGIILIIFAQVISVRK